MANPPRRDWKALGEALGVFALIMLYIWSVRFYFPWAALPVLAFVAGTHFVHGESPRHLGFGWAGLRAAFPRVMPWVAALVLALAAAGLLRGSVRKSTLPQALLGVLIYSVWGLFQQYLLNAYFVNRLAEFQGHTRGQFVPLAAAILFGLAHLPNWFLAPVTFAGGYICARLYLAHRSLYVLALAHGLVGFALLQVVPDSVTAHFVIGPRYLLPRYVPPGGFLQ
ncbi:MAG TPA: CPBP family intramembrane glutamic endopeptidase [Bryobacteraceae bacterium]